MAHSHGGEMRGDERIADEVWYFHYFNRTLAKTGHSKRSLKAMEVVKDGKKDDQ